MKKAKIFILILTEYYYFTILNGNIGKYLNQNGSKVAPAPILGYFLIKRKTHVFPYFMRVCESSYTTIFILLATATWILVLGFWGAFESIWAHSFALFCLWERPRALENPSRRYLKRYLKFKNWLFSRKISTVKFVHYIYTIFSLLVSILLLINLLTFFQQYILLNTYFV